MIFVRWRSDGCRVPFSITSTAPQTTRVPTVRTPRVSTDATWCRMFFAALRRSTSPSPIMGQKLATPFYCSPTALQRLFHPMTASGLWPRQLPNTGRCSACRRWYASLEELRRKHATPQVYQFYFHKDRGLNRAMMQRAKEAAVNVMMLTVDSITGGNRERDLRTGFSIPFRLTLGGMMQFALRPLWGINYVTHERSAAPATSTSTPAAALCRSAAIPPRCWTPP